MSQVKVKNDTQGEKRKLSVNKFEEMIKTAPVELSYVSQPSNSDLFDENSQIENSSNLISKTKSELAREIEGDIISSLSSLISPSNSTSPNMSLFRKGHGDASLAVYKGSSKIEDEATDPQIIAAEQLSATLHKFRDVDNEFNDIEMNSKSLKHPDVNQVKLKQFQDEEDTFEISNESVSKKKPFLITKYKPKSSTPSDKEVEIEDEELDLNNFKGKLISKFKAPNITNSPKLQKISLDDFNTGIEKSEDFTQIDELIEKAREVIKIHEAQQKEQQRYNAMIVQQKEYFIECIKRVDQDLTTAFSKLDQLKARKKEIAKSEIIKTDNSSENDVKISNLVICIYFYLVHSHFADIFSFSINF
eukprot:NODE_233_length_13658_cov_0.453647.p2 type:complete len:361 gc:universal NODE_233_length_13658_cov_0.453647:4135-5217(+)